MGWLDDIGHTAKSLGKAAIAAPGAVYDTATYVMPGDQWGEGDDHGFGGLLNSIGGRFNDMLFAVPKPVRTAFGGVMHGADVAYHQGIDRPLSTAMTMASHLDSGGGNTHYGDLFSGDAWAHAYDIADKQSLGQSIVFAVDNNDDPFAVETKTETPFQAVPAKNHPVIANIAAVGTDIGVSWFLDPFVLAGKGAGVVRQTRVMGAIPEAAKPTFAKSLDGAVDAVHRSGIGRALEPDWNGRFDGFFKYINGDNKLGRRLIAPEIRAISPEIAQSAEGRAISSALEDALKISDPAQRENAARRVFAVGAGDASQIDRLQAQIAGTNALADKLRNIVQQKTADLTDQALMQQVKNDPAFRAKFNTQIAHLDESGDVTKFVNAWHKQVATQLSGEKLLLDTQGTLTNMPAVHGRGSLLARSTEGRLKSVAPEAKTGLQKTEAIHDNVVDRLTRFPGVDSYSSVYQKGLHTLPLMVAYPAKWTANLLPSKALPQFVRNLGQTHYVGFVNTHDWDGGIDQLDSMMRVAGVDDAVRLKELSSASRSRTEMDKIRTIERIEHVAMSGIVQRISAKHGIDIDRDFVRQAMLDGQIGRSATMGAGDGGRIYAATRQDEELTLRTRGVMSARTAAKTDDKLAAESGADALVPRMDHYVDESGTPLALPVVSSQLANRIPLFDVHLANKAADTRAWAERMAAHAEAWKVEARDLHGLQNQLARATGTAYTRLERAVYQKRQTMDAILHAASVMNRWWKTSVLFRLGYPMRVITDDHMRIAARMGYMPFLGANVPEAVANSYYNYMPGVLSRGSRRAVAKRDFLAAQAERDKLVNDFGRKTAPSDEEWAELKSLHSTILDPKTSAEDYRKAHARMLAIDPKGGSLEYAELQQQVRTAQSTISGKKGAITRWRATPGNEAKIAAAEAAIAEQEGRIANATEQLAGRVDPDEMRKAIDRANKLVDKGPRGFLNPKRHIGEAPVKVGDDTLQGAFDSPAGGYYTATSSSGSFDYQLTDGEESAFNLLSSGHWRTVAPTEAGYYQLWANILNHQFQHSPEFMSIVRGEVKTPEEFASWLRQPENAHIVDRMQHYAHDPEDWAHRLLGITRDYIPTNELMALVKDGRVSARQLQKLFPDTDARRPFLHGQLADVQSGRNTATRAFSQAVSKAFTYLSEVPTDRLSRHPYFNAMYKREVRAAYGARVKAAGEGASFSAEDLRQIESTARQRALAELKRTLWDISAHSHAAHTLRFLSPFFAAHQEALTRWWHLAQDDPSIIRHFQLFFDAPRKFGLEYNDKGEVVQPGEGIGPGNHIMMRLPFAGENNAVNKWLKKVGGGHYWNVNENGLNLILQNGLANPGAGPVVTVPLEVLVHKYADQTELEKAARAINQYPPTGDSTLDVGTGLLIPAWGKRALALVEGEKSAEFGRYYMQNFADELTTFRLQYDREPTQAELDGLQDKASKSAHRDLVLMLTSNLASITPAKPNSKFYLVQNGLQRLYEQMRTEGHDMDWLRENFSKKYGEAYMAMIYSMGTDPANLDGNAAEVSSIRRYDGLLKHVDPSLTRMVIGPDVAGADDEHKMYSSAAVGWLKSQESGNGESYLGSKDPRKVAAAQVVNAGWRQYDELTNYLDTLADDRGEGKGYESYPDLVAKKRIGLDYIKQRNEVFAFSYDTWSRTSFDAKVSDMRQIVSNKSLASNPGRTDIYWLAQYIQLRDMMTSALAQRKAAGGASTMSAKANADLARLFAAGVSYLNNQSPYFKQFAYTGVIERDPYLAGQEVE